MSSRYERELVNLLDDLGWGVMRAPSSGAVTDRDLPDVLAGINGAGTPGGVCAPTPLAIEHKSTSKTTAYVGFGEVKAIERFADRFGATPLLGVRYTAQGTPTDHYLVRPHDARLTDQGNYGLPIEDIEKRATIIVSPGDPPSIGVDS